MIEKRALDKIKTPHLQNLQGERKSYNYTVPFLRSPKMILQASHKKVKD